MDSTITKRTPPPNLPVEEWGGLYPQQIAILKNKYGEPLNDWERELLDTWAASPQLRPVVTTNLPRIMEFVEGLSWPLDPRQVAVLKYHYNEPLTPVEEDIASRWRGMGLPPQYTNRFESFISGCISQCVGDGTVNDPITQEKIDRWLRVGDLSPLAVPYP